MNLTNYLTNLSVTALNLGTDLAYGYSNLAVTEINSLKDLLSKAEEMIPVIETEACMAEAEELDRENRSFNYWMTMLYGNGNNSVSPVDAHTINKANRLKRRKQNKKHHKADRKHGKPVPQSDNKYWDEQSGTFYRWDEKRKTFSSHKKPVRKTFRDRLNSAMTAREQEYISSFSEKGELMDKVDFLDEAISFGEREIENLEYEKAFGYLSDRGDIVIEECKRSLSGLKDYRKDMLRIIRSATR